MTSRPVACSIGGSDSGGGAGIQADIRTFAALGVHGATVVTAVTAQNTLALLRVDPMPVDMVTAQLDAVADDLAPRAWKTGMLATAEIVLAVAGGLRHHGARNVVVDPVLTATVGGSLLDPAALAVLVDMLLPLATVCTPNIPEAEAITGMSVIGAAAMARAARAIAALGPPTVVVTGGHAQGAEVVDVVHERGSGVTHELRRPRVAGDGWHGTGCTFSAAVAALLARGHSPAAAVAGAGEHVAAALRRSAPAGRGLPPVG